MSYQPCDVRNGLEAKCQSLQGDLCQLMTSVCTFAGSGDTKAFRNAQQECRALRSQIQESKALLAEHKAVHGCEGRATALIAPLLALA